MTIRRRTLALVAAASCLPALTGCGLLEPESGPVPVTITSSSWNGWDRNHKPTPKTTTIDATKGASVPFTGFVDFEITFTDVGEDSVELTTSEPMSPRGESGGLHLRDTETEFTVERGETLRFSTPTMDGGMHYEVTLASR
ncbi:hypothetical protein [Janibacter limosus]|uniref:hypothetical protein n=1 Tax=Janibacter limosus TaxID=53458 RepID=UPI000837287C|nr:hypothetical protein [Janibacter limosus]